MGPRLVNKTSAPQFSLTGRGPSIFEEKETVGAQGAEGLQGLGNAEVGGLQGLGDCRDKGLGG